MTHNSASTTKPQHLTPRLLVNAERHAGLHACMPKAKVGR
jgi:hypothetical protein